MMLEWAYNYPNTLYDIPIPPKVIDCDNIHLGFFPVHTTSANSHTRILNYINKIQICATFNQRSRPMQFYNYLTFIIMSNCKNKLFFLVNFNFPTQYICGPIICLTVLL